MNRPNFAASKLKSFVERIERVEIEIASLNADKSDIYKEAKGEGFDVAIIRKVVRERAKDELKRDEQGELFDLYWGAIHGANQEIPLIDRTAKPRVDNPDWMRVKGPAHVRIAAIMEKLESEGVLPSIDTQKTVYFVRAVGLDVIKIGIADDIKRRLANLGSACPVPLELLATTSGGRKRELELHKQFEAYRTNGEWFAECKELLDFIDEIKHARVHAHKPTLADIAIASAHLAPAPAEDFEDIPPEFDRRPKVAA